MIKGVLPEKAFISKILHWSHFFTFHNLQQTQAWSQIHNLGTVKRLANGIHARFLDLEVTIGFVRLGLVFPLLVGL